MTYRATASGRGLGLGGLASGLGVDSIYSIYSGPSLADFKLGEPAGGFYDTKVFTEQSVIDYDTAVVADTAAEDLLPDNKFATYCALAAGAGLVYWAVALRKK